MQEDDILIGSLMEECWMTLEQVAHALAVEPAWLESHLEAGLFHRVDYAAGAWRFSGAELRRASRMRSIERDFDADPELAALIADLLEELDEVRTRLRRAGLE